MSREVNATLGCKEDDPNGVIFRGEQVELNITGNISYPSPPDMLGFSTAITNAKNARSAYGGGTGTEAQRVAYVAAISILFGLIQNMLNYVNLTTPHQEVPLATSGFPLSHDPHDLPLLESPQNLHRFIARNIGMEKAKLNCTKPANVAPHQRVYYKYFRNTVDNFSTAIVVGEETKTTHIDVPGVTVPTVFYYWVTAHTPAGESEPSDVCKVTIVPVI